ncbi:hypothetical protein Vadar_022305 [Vaccinium darrowii]|uniref:Uncharacterized protein n=1 Tax=Vaccinium darrowii TaxID=229202 RepID=A0ACB7X2Y7_9ERIC|nr:hypothetical protein Vadar_022305 [Vaccinium darrowii]
MARDTGAARNWREAPKRKLTAPSPRVIPTVPQVVTWERFVKGFNDHYCPESYRLEQEIAFTRLEQGTMTVPEYEARFAALSRVVEREIRTRGTATTRYCFKCGATDHTAKECPNAVRGPKYFTYDEFGLRAMQCPRAQTLAASSVGNVQGDRGGRAGRSSTPGKVHAITHQGAQASPNVVTEDLDDADVESLFSIDDEATSETVLAFSLEDSESESDNEIQTFQIPSGFQSQPQPTAKVQIRFV